ncbi:MAG TPA: hypothetical protein VKP30_25135 [Polyangiaceae bacterium]|nr:hypothetical protein [Polyangiaceae bacterium]
MNTAGAGTAGSAGSLMTGGAGVAALPPLCSVESPSCDPDDAKACDIGAQYAVERSGSAGSHAELAGGGSGGVAGLAGAPGKACRIVRESAGAVTACVAAGTGTSGEPCVDDASCAPGLGCVEENGTAQCRPYCCHGNLSCLGGTYCDSRPRRELQSTGERLWVSVCIAGVSCRFDDPYPCSAERKCSCPSGKACSVVREDGTTACVAPGIGTEGQPCPCKAGYVCAGTRGTCLQVCDLDSQADQCSGGICQTSVSLPPPWGLCVTSIAIL